MTALRGLVSALCVGALLPVVAACSDPPSARSTQSFDEIARRVGHLSAAEIGSLLGASDSRQPIYLRDERWIWWNYTYLDGEDYPPEERGQVVHLEITFRKPDAPVGVSTTSDWRVAEHYGIAFRRPGQNRSESRRTATRDPGRLASDGEGSP